MIPARAAVVAALTTLAALLILACSGPAQGTRSLRSIKKGPWKQGYKIPAGWVQYIGRSQVMRVILTRSHPTT